jgi:hypothetical protein
MRRLLAILLLLGVGACTPGSPPPVLGWARPLPPGRLLLSNLDFGPTHVEAVVTRAGYCGAGTAGRVSTADFVLPQHGTRIIDVPPGAIVCWRRDRDPDHPTPGQWTDWARAFLNPGLVVEMSL